MPLDASSLAARAASVSAAMDALQAVVRPYLDSPASGDEQAYHAQRRTVIDAAQNLLRAVQDPGDMMIEVPGQVAQVTAMRLFWGVGCL